MSRPDVPAGSVIDRTCQPRLQHPVAHEALRPHAADHHVVIYLLIGTLDARVVAVQRRVTDTAGDAEEEEPEEEKRAGAMQRLRANLRHERQYTLRPFGSSSASPRRAAPRPLFYELDDCEKLTVAEWSGAFDAGVGGDRSVADLCRQGIAEPAPK